MAEITEPKKDHNGNSLCTLMEEMSIKQEEDTVRKFKQINARQPVNFSENYESMDLVLFQNHK